MASAASCNLLHDEIIEIARVVSYSCEDSVSRTKDVFAIFTRSCLSIFFQFPFILIYIWIYANLYLFPTCIDNMFFHPFELNNGLQPGIFAFWLINYVGEFISLFVKFCAKIIHLFSNNSNSNKVVNIMAHKFHINIFAVISLLSSLLLMFSKNFLLSNFYLNSMNNMNNMIVEMSSRVDLANCVLISFMWNTADEYYGEKS